MSRVILGRSEEAAAMRGTGWAIVAATLLGPVALAQRAEPTAPPERIGPVWDYRTHQPNPSEVEARERALGMPQAGQSGEAKEVDQLYRELTGSDPKAMPRPNPRDADRR
ncbi:hypothetical protein E2C06_01540 [Dankookia rubra]|uniref:Uncharacterized protein n=1 Tax=Dankookia rubra TaxID=1442381 RepID=A0A4R5QM75_9PROT|nr:hypothetical protein [Dankookia rubra]TDH64650.1 hypothetical protein E2C06_01540 [Dankookia rubra]